MEEVKKNIIELELDKYQEIISENASMKKELEYFKQPKEETPIIVSNSHSLPEKQEEKIEKKKGIFSFE